MSFWQALAIALVGYVGAAYTPWLLGCLGGSMTLGKPLVGGLIIGLILGDVKTGILMGAAIQGLYIGIVTPGLSVPADVNFATYVGIPLAMLSNLPTSEAVALSVPLSFFGVGVTYLVLAVNTLFAHWQERLIHEGRLKTAVNVPVYGQITTFITRFFPILLINYFGAPYVAKISALMPVVVKTILTSFGAILPAVGFGMLLSYIIKKDFDLMYFFFGFLLTAGLKLSVVPVLLIAVFLAYLDFKYQGQKNLIGLTSTEEVPRSEPVLGPRDIRRAYTNWMCWCMSIQNMERMQAPGLVRMLGSVMHKMYQKTEDMKALLARHTPFFNTNPVIGIVVPGIVLGMEEEKAKGADVPDELILNTKTALMGPLAGIGDSLLQGTYIPILLSIGLGLSKGGSVLGPLFYAVVFLGTMIPLTMWLFNLGYKSGINAVAAILSSGLKEVITDVANIVGATVVGAISATYVTAKLGWEYKSGEMVISLQNVLDSIFPSLIPLLLTLLAYYLIAKRHYNIGRVFLIFLLIAVVGVLIGFFV